MIRLNKARIHARLQSKFWIRPTWWHGKECFSTSFFDSLKVLLHSRFGRHCPILGIEERLEDLQSSIHVLNNMHEIDEDQDVDLLKQIVRQASQLSGCKTSLEKRLHALGIRGEYSKKNIVTSLDKIGQYLTSCPRIAKMASSIRYGFMFGNIQIVRLIPFQPRSILGRARHTHAEIQLLTHHRLHPYCPSPRVIGISKATCYLCDLFLSHHPQYTVSATHGSIFEDWTVPDSEDYTNADRDELRGIVIAMNTALMIRVPRKSNRPFPAQSGIWHEPYSPSATSTSPCSGKTSLSNPSTMRRSSSQGPNAKDDNDQPPQGIPSFSQGPAALLPEPVHESGSAFQSPDLCLTTKSSSWMLQSVTQKRLEIQDTSMRSPATRYGHQHKLHTGKNCWLDIAGMRLGFELEGKTLRYKSLRMSCLNGFQGRPRSNPIQIRTCTVWSPSVR